jgi:hypothetical protein
MLLMWPRCVSLFNGYCKIHWYEQSYFEDYGVWLGCWYLGDKNPQNG